MRVKDEASDSEDVVLLRDTRHSPRAGPLSGDHDGFHKHASENAKFKLVVEVPTLKLLDARRKRARIQKEEIASTKPALHKLKIKKGTKAIANFDLDTISRRLDVLGPPGTRDFHVALDEATKAVAPPRAFFSDTWGGSRQETFPNIGKKMAAQHHFRDFMFPNSNYNPALPFVAGAAGLMFQAPGLDQDIRPENPHISRLIVKLPDAALWLYVGQYQVFNSTSLTQAEWLKQSVKVKSTWVHSIMIKDWGRFVRTRIALRDVLGMEPEEDAIEAAMQQQVAVTEEQIASAYNLGEERLGVELLKCVGYDEDFGQQVFERFSTWAPKPKKEKAGPKKSRKRKRATNSDDEEVSDTAECDDGHREMAAEQEEDDEMIDIQHNRVGTRSRP
ncbi:hypothetical protein FIBSPDRAFT_1044963 [Athelia psychrophila]|uniref:DUF6697 domain-containing protein n=1 Tax=Athelia psychrophila TaxID=1759441 RepID=A0A166IZ89_9AGAM|nr:hypothetical protein FIBSPDRAFT_1044963 [Fibularhizoctonia sp. CBS 109695]